MTRDVPSPIRARAAGRAARRAAGLFAASALLLSATAARAQSFASICGSPFFFPPPPAGSAGDDAAVVLLAPDEQHLFVSNAESASITVLDVGLDGALSLHGGFPTSPARFPSGMAMAPEGHTLYVTSYSFSGNGSVNVHSVAADGSLTQIQAAAIGATSFPLDGIVYVRLPGGDFVYVDDDDPAGNTVTTFPVEAGGLLGAPTTCPTGGFGVAGAFFSSPRLRAITSADNNRLFISNGAVGMGSNDVSVVDVDPMTGDLAPLPDSPFALSDSVDALGSVASGAIAVDPIGGFLYAGTTDGFIIKKQIDASSGVLASVPGSPFSTGMSPPFFSQIEGLEVRPDGAFVIASAPGPIELSALSTSNMTVAPFAPRFAASFIPTTGLTFNHAGDLVFAANDTVPGTEVSVYEFGHFDPFQMSVTVDPTGTASAKTGFATIHGTLSRSPGAALTVQVDALQKISHTTIITGSAQVQVSCGSGQTTWSAVITGAAFGAGTASVSVTVSGADPLTGVSIFQEAPNVPVHLRGGP